MGTALEGGWEVFNALRAGGGGAVVIRAHLHVSPNWVGWDEMPWRDVWKCEWVEPNRWVGIRPM